MDDKARIEDLEEALRRIVLIVEPHTRRHVDCGDREAAVRAIALDQLHLDPL